MLFTSFFQGKMLEIIENLYLCYIHLVLQLTIYDQYYKSTLERSVRRLSGYFRHFSVIYIKHCFALKPLQEPYCCSEKDLIKDRVHLIVHLYRPFVHKPCIWVDTNCSIIFFIRFIVLFKHRKSAYFNATGKEQHDVALLKLMTIVR